MNEVGKEILIAKTDIEKRVRELADTISRDYEGRELILIGILKGAFVFMADLVRQLRIPCQVDFVRLASYGTVTVSTGNIAISKDIETSIEGRDVLVVEDIVDTGLTLSALVERLKKRDPRSLKVCVFLDKKDRRKVPFEAEYVGFNIPDRFVVGYGLDFNEMYRFLPDICVIGEN
ncbi:MAG TPA: hypoxanthine phosphoribosyltransferase [Syntrophales bacterium]|nr:hypoxanthine phosphoribosyltransferase [Syntrophales bacterium]